MIETVFPAIGHIYEASFDELAFHLKFHHDGKTMQFAPAASADFSTAQFVTYRALFIRPGVFLVTWTEADKTTVTHVEDFEMEQVHTNITQPDHTFLNLSGSWKQLA